MFTQAGLDLDHTLAQAAGLDHMLTQAEITQTSRGQSHACSHRRGSIDHMHTQVGLMQSHTHTGRAQSHARTGGAQSITS